MHIREFMSTNVNVCTPENNCASAGKIMRRSQEGFLMVVDSLKSRRVIGMVTDRDILFHMVHLNLPASKIAVKTCMAGAPAMISASTDLDVAIGLMKKEALYRLPVSEEGRLVGMLSLEGLALAAHRQWAYAGAYVNAQAVTEILEAIAIARESRKGSSRQGHHRRRK